LAGTFSATPIKNWFSATKNPFIQVAAEEAREQDARDKKVEDQKRAQAIEASKAEQAANVKILQDYEDKKSEIRKRHESADAKISDLMQEKAKEEVAARLSKTLKERYDHLKKILEIEGQIADVQEAEQKKQQEADQIRQRASREITNILQRAVERFMPSLDELAHHGGPFGGTARGIERMDNRIKREFIHGDVAGARKDIVARDRLYDSLAARGVLAERTEAREIKVIQERSLEELKAINTKGVRFKMS
jgi:hypothetical protein